MTGADRGSAAVTRFDPWQNRPDRPLWRRPGFSRPRALLIWLAAFAVLVIGYAYRDNLAAAGWRILAGFYPGSGAG
jgi:hypothetical protein